MSHMYKTIIVTLTCIFFSITLLPTVHAEPQPTIKVEAEIINSSFWNCTFIKDGLPSKPSIVTLEWGVGVNGSNAKEVTLIPKGKTSGNMNIQAAPEDTLNLSICVKDEHNEILGKWSIFVKNKGQTEKVKISIPDKVEPLFEMTK